MTAPEQRPASERFVIVGDMLCEDVGHHTCGAGGEFGHEPYCGLEPLIPLDQLDAVMRAGSRFAARILPTGEHEECVAVEVWAGDRYEVGKDRDRRPQGTIELPREAADDLVLALGEVPRHELPEDERGPDPWEGM